MHALALSLQDVLRLLHLVQAPDYVMKAFKENCITGTDLLHLEISDFDDSRFRYPQPVRRKVMRIVDAWKAFCMMSGSMASRTVTLEQFVAFHNPSG